MSKHDEPRATGCIITILMLCILMLLSALAYRIGWKM